MGGAESWVYDGRGAVGGGAESCANGGLGAIGGGGAASFVKDGLGPGDGGPRTGDETAPLNDGRLGTTGVGTCPYD